MEAHFQITASVFFYYYLQDGVMEIFTTFRLTCHQLLTTQSKNDKTCFGLSIMYWNIEKTILPQGPLTRSLQSFQLCHTGECLDLLYMKSALR